MIADSQTLSKVTPAHQAKHAYVYIRQSSMGQVLRHGESTDLQYRLVDRAVNLGWPRERIQVIDDDLGKSGASSVHRHGFQFLIAEVGLGELLASIDRLEISMWERSICSEDILSVRSQLFFSQPGSRLPRLELDLKGWRNPSR